MKIFFIVFLIFGPSYLFSQNIEDKIKTNYAWQIALEAKGFSPGLIDGIWGRKSDMALKAYLDANSLPLEGNPRLNEEIKLKLEVDFENVFTTYTITQEDQLQICVISDDWNERAKLSKMNYEYLWEVVQGKFRCSKNALTRLNSKLPEDYQVGDVVVVPNIREPVAKPTSHLQVDLIEKTISGFNADGKMVFFFHCSVAKSKEKLPTQDTYVKNKVLNPNYTFNPKYWPEITNVDRVLVIQPGPKNPVGMAWVGLELPGYGMHGTPIPDHIGKTGSHGCFRLCNWHAIMLAKSAWVGMKVHMEGVETGNTAVATDIEIEVEVPSQVLDSSLENKTKPADNGIPVFRGDLRRSSDSE